MTDSDVPIREIFEIAVKNILDYSDDSSEFNFCFQVISCYRLLCLENKSLELDKEYENDYQPNNHCY